jgi:hypothetical protein
MPRVLLQFQIFNYLNCFQDVCFEDYAFDGYSQQKSDGGRADV